MPLAALTRAPRSGEFSRILWRGVGLDGVAVAVRRWDRGLLFCIPAPAGTCLMFATFETLVMTNRFMASSPGIRWKLRGGTSTKRGLGLRK